MAKLYELLSVDGDLEKHFNEVIKETSRTFQDEVHLFVGAIRTLEWLEEGREKVPAEHQEMTTTVNEKLNHQKDVVIRFLDAFLQKERTNQDAKADIIIDGNIIAESIPATFLLGLENRLAKIRDVYAKIPTLPPNIKWEKDKK